MKAGALKEREPMDEEKREGREEERPKTRCLRCRGTGVIFWGCGEDPSKCDECGGSGEVEKKGGEESPR